MDLVDKVAEINITSTQQLLLGTSSAIQRYSVLCALCAVFFKNCIPNMISLYDMIPNGTEAIRFNCLFQQWKLVRSCEGAHQRPTAGYKSALVEMEHVDAHIS